MGTHGSCFMFSEGISVHYQISTPLREILIKEFPSRALTALSSINNKRESYATSKSNFRAPPRSMINDFDDIDELPRTNFV